MPTVIGHHDVDHWLASPKREEVFGPLGITNIRTFVSPQNRTQVAVLMDVADLDVVMAAMQNPEMAAAMEYDGVLPRDFGDSGRGIAPADRISTLTTADPGGIRTDAPLGRRSG